MADLLAWAERFVRTPSESRLGNEAIARAAAELCGSLGLSASLESVDVAGVRQHALVCDVGPAGAEPGLLLVTHLDTVPPGDSSAWTATGGDPFRPTRDGDRLFGLGSADAKLDFVCKALALADRGQSLRRKVRLVGTFGEEIGMLGARWLVETGRARGYSQALVGEPSELACVHAHKGYAVFEARVPLESLAGAEPLFARPHTLRGAAAHSSAPEHGRNAIEAALALCESSGAAGVAGLAGGGAVNVVPDHCELALAFEEPPGESVHEAVWSVKPLVRFLAGWRALQDTLRSHSDSRFVPAESVASLGRVALGDGAALFSFDLRPVPGADAETLAAPLGSVAELRLVRAAPPLGTDPGGPLVRAVRAAQRAVGLAERTETKATCTEAGLFARAGLEAVVLGPGTSVGNVHRPNEHTRVSQLERAVTLYGELLARLAGGAACS
jgi:succinyl-diaminopimelate desuccinylase